MADTNISLYDSQKSQAEGQIPINPMYPGRAGTSGPADEVTGSVFLEHASQHETEFSKDEIESKRVVTAAQEKLRLQSHNFDSLLSRHNNNLVEMETRKDEIISAHKTGSRWYKPPEELDKELQKLLNQESD